MNSADLHHFETFLLVAEQGGFTAAAKQLNISKAAVSHSVRLLEESLRVPLFIRTTRSIRLTEEGELLFTQCKRLQHELNAARDLVSQFDALPKGTLRISANPYLAETVLLEKLEHYMQQFPKINVEVLTEERMPDMQKEQIDVVFGINWPAPSDVIAKTIGKTRYVLCASNQYLAKHGTPSTLKDLERHHYIPHLGRTQANFIANLKQPSKLNITTPLRLNNALFMKQCALKGLGIVQLHDYMVQAELASGELVEILAEMAQPEIPLYIYYFKYHFVQPKVRQFVQLFDKNSI